ncbi:MAG: DUF1801 domain-containing protein [Flavobacteriales bacterium]|nr:DUF1801 domain-containing protein [Flavobacteriales bacterium]
MRNPTKKPASTDDYIAMLLDDQRKALTALRKQILAAAPKAEEYFGYGLPGFKYKGHPLVYMGAAKKHVALYGMVPAGFAERLKGFTVSKGTIQFTPEKPLPAALVKDIVKLKCAEIEERWPSKTPKAPAKKAAKKK